ncbi:hypothetical protein SAICODRAFT_20175 [Saitoella complicata NRRL Y-17804]|uniref:Conserved oligomeric Golgi complex subunit 1 n=1 Tax=Saitoella complicata (strain BCRC 22490 / CBS 7301 / JCM 7358 / NBRC 10748 / NRRL Y-17804) TaxID=698492 RepID=A0A0E9NQT5_SAICN|nr:uncharacterized protein SAICODRAFT_20175 [Saitoella complicata NRRL Y-17804]ODQ51852.1 hypothetical protein SAICODRAFT_20175 [Saitoella complicata NRRL Y-17804]GAO51785.1 hypothetical protein G7K_5876-t1 [Saitoella complicata NRRL Y-17804]
MDIDLENLGGWEDVFRRYPVQDVVQIERALRERVQSKKKELLDLVNDSYRDLLSTTDTLSTLRESCTQLNAKVSDALSVSDYDTLQRLARAQSAWEIEKNAKVAEKHSLAARLSLLKSIPSAIRSLLSTNLLAATKLFLLSRSILKSLPTTPSPLPYISTLDTRISTLRPLIARKIDNVLAAEGVETGVLVNALAAFAVLHAAGQGDVLQHFLSVRLDSARELLSSAPSTEELLKAVGVYTTSLHAITTIFPTLLSPTPTLTGPALLALSQLGLDKLTHWLSEDIRHFTPWTPSEPLLSTTISEYRKAFISEILDVIGRGARVVLGGVGGVEGVRGLRNEVLKVITQTTTSNGSGRKRRGRGNGENIDVWRKSIAGAVRERVKELLEQDANSLAGCIHTIRPASGKVELWSDELTSLPSTKGAKNFLSQIRDRTRAQTSSNAAFFASWTVATTRIHSDSSTLETWVKLLGDGEEEGEVVEVFGLDAERDELREYQRGVVEEGYAAVFSALEHVVDEDGGMQAARAAGLVRIVRHVRETSPLDKTKGEEVLRRLEALFADAVTIRATEVLAAHTLPQNWTEELPELRLFNDTAHPTQPTLGTYRTALTLAEEVYGYGVHMLTGEVLGVVRARAGERWVRMWRGLVSALEERGVGVGAGGGRGEQGSSAADTETKSNDAPNGTTTTDVSAKLAAQLHFDILFLATVLNDAENGSHLSAVAEEVREEFGVEDGQEVRDAVEAYRRRVVVLV